MITGKDILLTEVKDHIFIMTINREERRNAISQELMDRLAQEWERFNEDEDLWVAILTGRGDISFSSGHDMKEDVEGDVRGGAFRSHKRYAPRKPHPTIPTWKPTIAAINGYCLAGGWSLAQNCDIRIASEHATFGLPEVKWNLSAGFGARLEYQISIGVVCEMLMWGRNIDAKRAYEIGFVNKVVPGDQLMDECMEWAEYMCTLGQPSVRAHKELIYRGRDIASYEMDSLSKDLFYWFPAKPGVYIDATEGPKAFLEKKDPEFNRSVNA